MTDFLAVRGGVAARFITEDAECPEVAEKTLRELMSGLRALRVKAARNAAKAVSKEPGP